MSDMLVEEIKAQVKLRLIEESIPRIRQCLDLLTISEIWQRPNPSSNSIGNLTLHLCGNVRQYLVASIGRMADTRERGLEFKINHLPKLDLIDTLQKLEREILEAIEVINKMELERIRNVQGFEMSGLSVVVHVIEHFSYHTGQIAFFTKLLKDVDLKFYGDMDLSVTGS